MIQPDYSLLKDHLIELGAEESEIDTIIDNVSEIITEKIINDYVETIENPELKKTISALPSSEIVDYFEKNKTTLPPISEDRCKSIAESTWKDYVDFMTEKTE